MKDCVTYGYKTITATAERLTQGIPGHAGQRIAVKGFSFTCGNNTSTVLTFMNTIAESNIVSTIAAGDTEKIVLLSNAIGGGTDGAGNPVASALASGDYIGVIQDDGSTHFTRVHSITNSTIQVSVAFTDTVADGAVVYGMGAASDVDQMHLSVKHATETVKSLEGGLFYGKEKDYPMMLHYLSLNTSSMASLNYLTVQYINS